MVNPRSAPEPRTGSTRADGTGVGVGAGRPATMQPLPENLTLHLVATGRITTGPGVVAANAAIDEARLHHAGDRRGWQMAGLAVAQELATAVLAGRRGQQVRPLARLVLALAVEAAAARP